MMTTRRTTFHFAMIALLAAGCFATAEPTSQPTTTAAAAEATTRPAMKLYACFLGRGGFAFGSDIVGLPVLQQVEPQWFGDKVAYAKRKNVGLFIDYEEALSPRLGIATTNDLARLAQLDQYVAEMRRLLQRARADAGGERMIAAYTDLPLGQRWQYDDDQTAYIADNRRIAASGALRDADALCVHAYLHVDDIKWMNPQSAAIAARKRIAAARVYDKPMILFISPVWVGGNTEVSAELLEAQLEVARDEGIDACLWTGSGDAPFARAQAARAAAVFARVVAK